MKNINNLPIYINALYHLDMRNFILTFVFLFFISAAQIGNCATVTTTTTTSSAASRNNAASSLMAQSNKTFHDSCIALANNFRYDSRFAFYIKARCQLFEIDRQRLLQTIYPISTSDSKEYRANYANLMSQFAIDLNSKEITELKRITTEYCKYNSAKFSQKDPKACSTERINSLF